MKNLINNVRIIVNAQFTRLCSVIDSYFKSDLIFFTFVNTKDIVNKSFTNSKYNDKSNNNKKKKSSLKKV